MRVGLERGRMALLTALAASLACASAALAGDEWIEVSMPSEGETLRAAGGVVELRGRVGSGAPRGLDVVIALDRSQSTLMPTGVDLDGDGLLGTFTLPGQGDGVCGLRTHYATASRSRCPFFRNWTTDFDDIVIQAERRLARRILTQLETQGARVALVDFSGKARVKTELGPPSQALAALDALAIREDTTGSDVSAAVRRSLGLLRDGGGGAERGQAVLLVTDGIPSVPKNERIAAAAARRAAEAARDARIPLYIFQIRSEEEADTVLLAEMAELHGGRRIFVDVPERLAFALPQPSFARVDSVAIRNRTLERDARAVRVYPGGAFDAFVPVGPGENVLEIEARLPDGGTLELLRTVYFEQPERPYASDTARMRALLDELRRRTLETEHGLRPAELEPDYRSLSVRTAEDGEAEGEEPVALPGEPKVTPPGAP